jgi:hypothetical protein
MDMQRYVAWLSVGPSTVRGQRTPGLVAQCRRMLAAINLESLAVNEDAKFRALLDERTLALQHDLPSGCQHWGLARKLLNIFLRSALYNTYLRERFKLAQAEAFLELPLDRQTATGLISRSASHRLPRWTGVKHLQPEASELFQRRASEIAREHQIARVHLDITLWLDRG